MGVVVFQKNNNYDVPSHLSQELRDIIHCLLTVNPTERPELKGIVKHPWCRKGDESSSRHCDKMSPRRLDPAIMAAMAGMGFNPHDIQKSLLNRLFDEPMATYGLLKCQARQQGDFEGITPFPTPTDTATFPLCQKRTTDVPTLRVFLSLSD
ncbi:Sperm motility kinase Z [Microtus ochrogaster]|uniref:non-specific serine/threonine protein kinase n=1 Tax=Microtus ochrogaster TaxID=79684 RepID=A0A8J6GFF3_MICOH|nr:Sperm motility kinase Z [Microtus ochrogaster]